jgi:aldose 1-epimerase
MISTEPFGLHRGHPVTAYVLQNQNGIVMRVIDYGCTITSLQLKDKEGLPGEVVLGFDSMDGYLASPHYIGGVIGPVAGRIANGLFEINDREYFLTKNAEGHHLHGGATGFDKVIWQGEPFENEKGIGVDFRYTQPDGHDGYPGPISFTVRYYLTHNDALIINYIGVSPQATVINPTQHTYWNLSAFQDSVLNHGLQINAERFLPINDQKLPTGELHYVIGTPFDFRQPKLVRDAFQPEFAQVVIGRGIDHCFALNHEYNTLGEAAMLYDPGSGRLLTVHTSSPGLQIYTGNALNGYGRDNEPIIPFSGICLETQHFPDAVHHAEFPSVIVNAGEMWQGTTVFQFSVLV